MAAAYYDFFRKIILQPDNITLEADSTTDTLTITGGAGVALNPNASTDSFTIDVDYQLYVPIGTTEIRLNDVNSNFSSVNLSAGSNIVIGRNSNSELVITATVGGTSKAISDITRSNPAVVTTTNPHQFTEGIAVTITDVNGMTEVNGNEYYMDILTGSTFALYEDSNLTTPLNSTGFTLYSSGGVATAEYSAPQSLTQLNDVDLISTPPVTGSFLQYNGTFWGTGTSLAASLTGDVVGSVFADDSTLLVDGVNGIIPWSVIDGAPTSLSAFTNDPGYLTTVAFNDLTTTPTTLAGYGITDAATSSQGTLADTALQPGDSFDIKGSVFADDSTLLVDAVNGLVPDTVVQGPYRNQWDTAYGWGDHSTVGYLTSVTTPTLSSVLAQGNNSALGIDVGASTISGITLTGTVIDTADSSPLTITPSVTFDTAITVSDVVPSINTAIDLGSSSLRYREVHSQTINAVDPAQAGFFGDGRVRTNRLYLGDENYSAHLYAPSTTEWSWTGGSMDPGPIYHNRATYVRWKSTSQLVSNFTNPVGTVDVDFLLSDTHYFYQPTGALTVNFTGIPTDGSRMINMRIYIYQAATAYVPTTVQVNGVTKTIEWQNGVVPTGTSNNFDFVQFLIWSFGGGTFTVLGQANSYS
jgi:hypothetical protein